MNVVGGHIRKLRRKADMTQQTLADRLNVTRQAVSQWENGNTQPDLDTLAAISGVFGVDMMEVIYGEKRREISGIDPVRRKRYLTGLIVFGAIVLIVGVVRNTWGVYLDVWSKRYYDFMSVFIFASITGPLFYILMAISVMNVGSLIWDIRICRQKIRRLVFAISLIYLSICYIIIVIPIVINEDYPWFFFKSMSFILNNPAIFLIPGIGLFLGLNGRRTERNAECRK